MKQPNDHPVSGLTVSGVVSVLAIAVQSTFASDRLYVYPNEGQPPAQISDDRYQCHRWAVAETGFNPLNEAYAYQGPVRIPVADNPKQGATGRGALTGAAVGAVIGAIDDHHTGEGAAIGALVGAIAGGVVENRGYQQVRAEAEEVAHQEAASQEWKALGRRDYRRAISACLEARNYTVK